jgi:hypothetical protein
MQTAESAPDSASASDAWVPCLDSVVLPLSLHACLRDAELGSKRVDTLVLGNLSRDDAEAYFTHRAEQCRIPLPPEQEERSRLFDRIHQASCRRV